MPPHSPIVDGLPAPMSNQHKRPSSHDAIAVTKALRADRGGPRSPSPRCVTSRRLSLTLSVPAESVGCIIGKGGRIIQQLRRESGTQLIFENQSRSPQPRSPQQPGARRRLTIVGSSREQIEHAQHLVLRRISSQHQGPPCHSPPPLPPDTAPLSPLAPLAPKVRAVLRALHSCFLVEPVTRRSRVHPDRVMHKLQEAHWWYLDYYQARDKELPNERKLFPFVRMMASLFPWLAPCATPGAVRDFQARMSRTDSFGAVVLNASMTRCVLVKSAIGDREVYTFPRGKIERGETQVGCAVREVQEETGLDIAGRIDPSQYVAMRKAHGGRRIKLFVVAGMPSDAKLSLAGARQEIARAEWFDLADLESLAAWDGPTAHASFRAIAPFMPQLSRWIADHHHSHHSAPQLLRAGSCRGREPHMRIARQTSGPAAFPASFGVQCAPVLATTMSPMPVRTKSFDGRFSPRSVLAARKSRAVEAEVLEAVDYMIRQSGGLWRGSYKHVKAEMVARFGPAAWAAAKTAVQRKLNDATRAAEEAAAGRGSPMSKKKEPLWFQRQAGSGGPRRPRVDSCADPASRVAAHQQRGRAVASSSAAPVDCAMVGTPEDAGHGDAALLRAAESLSSNDYMFVKESLISRFGGAAWARQKAKVRQILRAAAATPPPGFEVGLDLDAAVVGGSHCKCEACGEAFATAEALGGHLALCTGCPPHDEQGAPAADGAAASAVVAGAEPKKGA